MKISAFDKIYSFIINSFQEDRASFFLWFPVLFGVGIVIYFSIPFEIHFLVSTLILVTSIALCFLVRKHDSLSVLSCIFLALCLGFFVANARTVMAQSPKVEKSNRLSEVKGEILQIQTTTKGKRFVIEPFYIKTKGQENKSLPTKIRVTINKEIGDVKIGDHVKVLAILNPPPDAVIDGGYDFSRFAYFKRIGAVGYIVSDVEIIKKAEGHYLINLLSNLRYNITQKILGYDNSSNGNVAAALLVGEKGGIDSKTLYDMRGSGLAHLLAISGMHLALVASLFFFVSRAIFASIEYVALRYNIKKWAAWCAICGSLFYLLISGHPISAERAFIMTTIFLLSIIVDRVGSPLRSVMIAAFIILFFQPESIQTPSFQMSFAAVIGLISVFNALQPYLKDFAEYTYLRKFYVYFSGVILSTFIAGMATAPFALYHFNQYASYSVLANLFAIPITSMWIMPWGVLSFFLMIFGLEQLALAPMMYGIDILLKIAGLTSDLPHANGLLPQMPVHALILITFGLLWLLLWQKKIRLAGFLPLILGVVLSFNINNADILIGGEGKLFAIKSDDNKLVFSSLRGNNYEREAWQRKFGQEESISIDKWQGDEISCDDLACIYKKNGMAAVIVKHPKALKEDCKSADVLINLTYFKPECKSYKKYINIYSLKNKGTYAVYMEDDIKVSSTGASKKRLWQR